MVRMRLLWLSRNPRREAAGYQEDLARRLTQARLTILWVESFERRDPACGREVRSVDILFELRRNTHGCCIVVGDRNHGPTLLAPILH